MKALWHSSQSAGMALPGPDLVPHRTRVEFALVLVTAGSDAQLEYTVRAVAANAKAHDGIVLQILGSLVLVGFSGVVGCASESRRQAFVAHVCSSYRLFTRIVHGEVNALVGTFGYEARMTYTVIPDDFGSIIERLSKLKYGEAVEIGVQPGASPNGSPATSLGNSGVSESPPSAT
jgi:hypothetical protein